MISPHQLESLTQKKTSGENIAERVQHDLEEKMQHVLKSPGPSYSKSLQYNDLLEKYLTLLRKEDARGREIVLKVPATSSENMGEDANAHIRIEEGEIDNDDKIQEEILDNIGSRNRKNAAYILQKLRDSDLLRWNRSGEIIVRDKLIKGSHMMDLMKTLTNRRFHTKTIPRGWEEFLKTISELNIPITVVTNTHAREQLRLKPAKTMNDSIPQIRRSKRKRGKKSRLLSSSLLDMDNLLNSSPPSEWRLSTPIPSEWLDFRK